MSAFTTYYSIILSLVLLVTTFARVFSMENLTAITWSHATNSQNLLTNVLKSEVKMIEADIVFGHLIDDPLKVLQPIMAHPPNVESDISLKQFLTQIMDFNKNNLKENQKGVKLDFKSTDVFSNSLPMLIELWGSMDMPVWINADIYRGPLNNVLTKPVDADGFFAGTKSLPNATLSTGWTTRWGSNFTEGKYTTAQVNEMIDGIRKNNVKNPLTFPVRAGIASQSISTLTHLYDSLKDSNHVTFTIWSSDNDFVNAEDLRKMIFHFGLDKVYVDVPEDLSRKLRLDVDPTDSGFNIKPNVALGLMFTLAVLVFFS